jgi:hypothetical protein
VVKMFALAFIWPHPTVYILGSLVVCVLLSRRWILPNCCFVWTQRNALISGVFPHCTLVRCRGSWLTLPLFAGYPGYSSWYPDLLRAPKPTGEHEILK